MAGIWLCVVLSVWSGAMLAGGVPDSNVQATFNMFVDQYWDWRMEQSPEFATKSGSNLHADKWQSLTEETFLRDKNKAEEFVAELLLINPDYLDEQDAITYKVILSTLKAFISGFKYRKYTQYNPITPMDHPSRDWKRILGSMPTETVGDYDNLIRRYKGVDTQINEMITLMREAIRLNTTQHSVALTGATERIELLLSDIVNKTSFFHQPLIKLPNKTPGQFSTQAILNITQTMTSAIDSYVEPAIRRFLTFIKEEYAPNTRSIPGVHSLPNGLELYQECLNWHLEVTFTPQEVHDMGLAEVQRIEKNVQTLMTQANFTGTMLEYLTYLKTLPENYYTTESAMLEGYRDIIRNTRDQLYKVLPDLPLDCPIIVEQSMNPQSWARYRDPSPDQSTPGAFIINVFNPDTRPTFDMVSLTLHEAEPGHHTQACYVLASGGERKGRKVTFLKYYAAPYNFPFFTSFTEGWALYAEFLGEEMGVYDTSNKLLGRYLNEIFRAVRLVVDTGIHAFGWSKQRAVDYIAKYSARSLGDIENEVNRYITWPGQACAYKVGELKIQELRRNAEETLGGLFDKRYFHKEILSLGSVPLSVLDEQIEKWVEYRLSSTVSGSNRLIIGIPIMLFSVLCTYLF